MARRRRRRNPDTGTVALVVGGVVVLGVGFLLYQQMQAQNALLAQQNQQGPAPTNSGGSSTAVGNTITDVGTGVQTGLNLLNNASA